LATLPTKRVLRWQAVSRHSLILNTANDSALEALPGVGPATAAAIVHYRNEHGPFTSIDDLENVPRLGTATIDKFRDQITISP
jgi:competence protein ComEA